MDPDYKKWQRETRLWWTDILVTLVLVGAGIDDIVGGMVTVWTPTWVAGSLLGLTPVCNATMHDATADDTVRLAMVAWGGARVAFGVVLFAVGFYRTYTYSTYLPLNMMYGGVVRLVLVSTFVGQGVAMLGALRLSVSSPLFLGWLSSIRLGMIAVAIAASFCIYEQTPWYQSAHEGYPQPEPQLAEARRGIFPRQGGLLRG